MANITNQKTKYLIGKWARNISLVEKAQGHPLNYEKRAALANTLENTDQRIKAQEAINPASIGHYKRYALDILTTTVPNLIAFDLYAVQAMDNRVGMINYIDFSYAKPKGQTKAGQVFNSSLNMGPSDPYYTSNLVKDEPLGNNKGTNEIGTQNAPLQLPWVPMYLNTITLSSGDDYASADEAGVITGVGCFVGATFDITADGKLHIKLDTGKTFPEDVTITYRYDSESVMSDGNQFDAAGALTGFEAGFTNVPEMDMNLKTVPVVAQPRALRSYWAFDAQYELQKEYGEDIDKLLATQAAGELAHEIDNELTLDLLKFANAGAPLVWSKSITPGISLVDHYDSLEATLIDAANIIYDANRRVKANFVVCGLGVASVIEVMHKFKASGISGNGPHFLGDLGNFKVYVNPDYPKNEGVVGFKGSNMFEAGAFYCPYMPVSSTDLIMDANFRGQRGWATLYGKKLLNSQLYIRFAITD